MAKEEQILSASIIRSRAEAQRAEADLSYIIERYRDLQSVEKDFEGRSEKEDLLFWHIETMLQNAAILAERLSLPILSKRLWGRLREAKQDGVNMTSTPYDVVLISEALSEANRLTAPLLDMVGATAVSGLSVFEAILRNTAAIIDDFHVDPAREADVRKEMFKVLQYAFPDMERDVPISQSLKTYRMDFGARSIAAAAEYKYADNEDELKKTIESVYADMKGHRGNYDFKNVYAIFYLTSPIGNIDQIEAEFCHVVAGKEWKPIVVCGRGGGIK